MEGHTLPDLILATLSSAANQSQQLSIKGAPEAILPCCSHVMTDDGPASIGLKLGIGDGETVLSGAQLDEMDDAALSEAIETTDVFARITPEQKLRLVSIMQQKGEHVAMLGSGVNDTPAMKQADVGVSMGGRSAEAARQSAELNLDQDKLPALAQAILESRTSHLNFQKIVQFMAPGNGAQALTIIVAVLFGLALPLMPLQVLWVNLVTAGLLAMTLAFEKPESSALQPELPTSFASLFSRFLVTAFLLFNH